MKGFLIFIICAYIVVLAAIYFMQRSMLFHPSTQLAAPTQYGLADTQEVTLTTKDNIKIIAWFKKPKANQPIVYFLHGNGGNLANLNGIFTDLSQAGLGVFAIDYRGYGRSAGSPSEKGLFLDAQAGIEYLQQQNYALNKDIIIVGQSLGTAIAVDLATKHNFKAVALLAPFKSAVSRAKEMYFFLPIDLLMKDKFESLAKLKKYNSKVAILHGTQDKIIPIEHAEQLYKKLVALNNEAKFYRLENIEHNNIPNAALLDAINWLLK